MKKIVLNEIEEVNLSKSYIVVESSFGGNQGWSDKKLVADYGCGLIAFNDAILYMKTGLRRKFNSKENYLNRLYMIKKDYFKFWFWHGIPGIFLSLAMNRFFKGNNMPYKAKWGVLPCNLKRRIKEMINHMDVPVIISVGPGYLNKNRVTLYERVSKKEFQEVNSAKGHYMTVTGYIEEPGTEKLMLRLSSWGKMYYMDYSEYEEYVKKSDNFYFSSILNIRKK